jgi:DNA-binding MarR family transcriptional regulator
MRAIDWKQALGLFDALAGPGRMAIFRAVLEAGAAGLSPPELISRLGMTGSAVTLHLRGLSDVGLIRIESGDRRSDRARTVVIRADLDTLDGLVALLRDSRADAVLDG